MGLFQLGRFRLHSGASSAWKIECDALTDDDITCLAYMVADRVPLFSAVEGVPRGGLRLAAALEPYVTRDGPLLIVDDVLTTGASMEEHRAGRDAKGMALFVRSSAPAWVDGLFWYQHPSRD